MRLDSPDLSPYWRTHNCYSITFDSGVIISQTKTSDRSRCKVKLILEPPEFPIKGDQLILEAKCAKIYDPVFDSYDDREDENKAFYDAQSTPLARLAAWSAARPYEKEKITHVKLQNICYFRRGNFEMMLRDGNQLKKLMCAHLERGLRSLDPAQSNGSSTEPAQTTEGRATPESSSGSTGPERRMNRRASDPGAFRGFGPFIESPDS